ncbi:MAG: hypothetical protein WC980_05890 [Candidatus Brocadiia bacterium]
MKKKLFYIGLGIAVVVLVFVGYHYVRFLQATARMKELSADLKKRIVEWEKKEYRRPPLFGPAVPGNAAEYYKKAIEKKIEKSEDIQDALWDSLYKFPYENKPLKPELLEWAKSYTVRIDLLKKGSNTESAKPLVHPRDKLSLTAARSLIRDVMVILGKDMEDNNKFLEAIELYCTSIRFGDDYRSNGQLIQMLVGIAFSSDGQGRIKKVLLYDKLNEGELVKLSGYLKTLIDSYPTFQNTWESEIVFMGVLIKEESEKRGFIPEKDDFWGWSNRTDFIDFWIDSVLLCNDVAKVITGSCAQVSDRINQVEESYKKSKANILVGGITGCYDKQMILDAGRKGIYILAALKLYKLRHGAYPETLDKLAPAIIPTVPLDPFSDQSFIYRVDTDGGLFLYSVGADLKDDNADPKKDIVISPKEKK